MEASGKLTTLRRAGVCARCGRAVPAGARAFWVPVERAVWCVECGADGVDTGVAGRGARDEAARIAGEEAQARRARWGVFGAVVNVVSSSDVAERWDRGAVGEELAARELGRLAGAVVLHDRAIPGARANIDHVVVSHSGVWVVDSKRYRGRVEVTGGVVRSASLVVGGVDKGVLVDGVARQVGLVDAAVCAAGWGGVPVAGALAFVDADWAGGRRSRVVDDVVVGPVALVRRLIGRAESVLEAGDVDRLAVTLSTHFPAYVN